MSDIKPVTRALISVSDKTGIVDFAAKLAALGVELFLPVARRSCSARPGWPAAMCRN